MNISERIQLFVGLLNDNKPDVAFRALDQLSSRNNRDIIVYELGQMYRDMWNSDKKIPKGWETFNFLLWKAVGVTQEGEK